MQDDSYYIKEVLRGDKQAYSFIINRYSNKLYAIILRMVKNPEDARDLVQECLIKAYSQLEKYGNTRSFASWLYRLSLNHCMDQFRKKRFQLVELQEESDQSNSAVTPESQYLQKEKYEHLEKLLELLPQEDIQEPIDSQFSLNISTGEHVLIDQDAGEWILTGYSAKMADGKLKVKVTGKSGNEHVTILNWKVRGLNVDSNYTSIDENRRFELEFELTGAGDDGKTVNLDFLSIDKTVMLPEPIKVPLDK
jgi:RNA polymerase sigma factor (sigma-70 family)